MYDAPRAADAAAQLRKPLSRRGLLRLLVVAGAAAACTPAAPAAQPTAAPKAAATTAPQPTTGTVPTAAPAKPTAPPAPTTAPAAKAPANAGVSFAGKTIDLILTGAAGGGTDTLGRIFAEHFTKHIPGNPRIAVQNVPGGGGLTGARQGARAKNDGSTIFIISSGLFRQEALGIELEGFKTAEMSMLGSHAGWEKNNYCLWVRSEVAQSWDDVLKLGRKIKFGSPGAGSNQGLLAQWLSLTDQPVEVVLGYGGTAEVFAAVDRGEVDAHGTDIGRASRAFPEWFKRTPTHVTPILAELDPIDPASLAPFGVKPPPLALDTVQTSESNRGAYKLVMDITTAGDVFSLPPNAPADVHATLKKAVEDTGKDPAYVAAAKQRDFSGGYWAPEYIVSAFDRLKNGTPEQITLIKAMVSG